MAIGMPGDGGSKKEAAITASQPGIPERLFQTDRIRNKANAEERQLPLFNRFAAAESAPVSVIRTDMHAYLRLCTEITPSAMEDPSDYRIL